MDESNRPEERERPSFTVRLPGFTAGREIGLGDLLKKVTYVAGIEPCSGCEKRAAALNRWVRFVRR